MSSSSTAPVIGVWYQPVSSFGKWKNRGINTLVGYEAEGGNVSLDAYCDAALAAGLAVILQWSTATQARAGSDPNVVAVINCPDEPDGAGNVPPAQMIAQYAAIKAVTTKPVLINFDGWKMQWRPASDYQAYVQAADWISVDYYPLNRGEGPGNIPLIGQRIRQLQSAVDPGRSGVRFFSFIETSNQDLKVQGWGDATQMRGPTAAEVSTTIDTVLAANAQVCYFPDVVGSNFESFDGTPDDVAALMTTRNNAIFNPGGIALAATPPATNVVAPTPPPTPPTVAVPSTTATPQPTATAVPVLTPVAATPVVTTPAVPVPVVTAPVVSAAVVATPVVAAAPSPAVASTPAASPIDLTGTLLIVNGRAYYLRSS